MVVFCTTCKGRTHHIERTLPANLADNKDSNAKFVLVNYNSPDHLNQYLQNNQREAIESGRLVVYNFPEPTLFRMAHAKNLAHRLGILEGGSILVNMDADNFTTSGFGKYLEEQFKDRGVFLWARKIQGRQGISGRIAVSASDFLKVGGYDEKFETHSPDDTDFNLRLCRLGISPREIDPKFLASINHTDTLRFRDYPHAHWNSTSWYSHMEELGAPVRVSNNGNLGCGVVFRNFSSMPMELLPLPTRIFGIGLHKTATSSLHKALTILNYDSGHWPSGDWARDVCIQMNESGRSVALESHYAISDFPIALFYQQLDQSYPGSKFILTVRSDEKWLESVRKHWTYEHNKFRWEWDIYPISNKIHKAIYGQKDFNAEVFLARYRRHTAEVKEYFRKRRNDLLVMNMEAGAGWPQLCGFLRCPIPPVPYPVEYVTE